jgi:HlyD family secretion protein
MANGKKSKKKIIIFSIIGVVLIALVALVVMGSSKETIITIQTEKIEKRTITQIVSATGKIQPETQVKINAEVSGEITGLPVREGDRVNKGDLLVRIKPDAYQAQYERAQAALSSSEANLLKSEAEHRRFSELFEKKLVSDSDMDIAKATYQSSRATFAQATASLKEARETLAKTTIYAPMNGVISQLNTELGERVSGSTFTQGTHIMTVADLSQMEARVDVGENDVVMVTVGDTARIEVDAYPDKKVIGLVSQIANTAKSAGLGTQDQVINFEVRIRLRSEEGVQLRPGMSMTADIETETRKNVFAVPIQSVTVRLPKMEARLEQPEEEGGAVLEKKPKKKEEEKLDEVVFVVDNGEAKTVVVKRGLSDDTYVEITGTDMDGKEVVSGPFKAINRDLENGSKVKVDNKAGRRTGPNVAQN